MTPQKTALVCAAADFYDAAHRLLLAWEAFDFSDPTDADRALVDAAPYPFAHSFDEVAHRIGAWAEAVRRDRLA